MNRHGYITKEEMNNAVKIPVTEGLQPSSEITEMKYQAFLDAVVKKLKKEYPDVNIGSDGLTIHTTLDQDAQDYAEKLWMAILLSIQTINSKDHSYLWIHNLVKFEQLELGVKEVSLLSKVIIWPPI